MASRRSLLTKQSEQNYAVGSNFELSELDFDYREYGTRFRLFPQSPILDAYQQPETVWVSVTPSEMMPGPADNKMVVVDAKYKTPYGDNFKPPYDGAKYAIASADAEGHFDHLEAGTPQFEAAHMYGTIRWILDKWQVYFGREIEWEFSSVFKRLELIPWLDWDNAHAGFGFIEMGYSLDNEGQKFPFNLNFDVLAHEFGHTMLNSVIGVPNEDEASTEFFSFHETAGDIIAIISLLHFDSVLDRLLDDSNGNLYTRNELNRVGEESNNRQIRLASHAKKMSDAPSLDIPLDELSYKQIHQISLPFTGALFDLLVEIFQHNLVDAGLISTELDQQSRSLTENMHNEGVIQASFDQAYHANQEGFKKALIDARDYMGVLLSLSWEQLSWDLNFPEIVVALIQADNDLSSGHYRNEITQVFKWREIWF